MSIYTPAEALCAPAPLAPVHKGSDQEQRIKAALGCVGQIPRVDEKSHSRYYRYLSENLAFPLAAQFPEPVTPQEEMEFRCTVVRLLDPAKNLGDLFYGIFCSTRQGDNEVMLPLIDLCLPAGSRDAQLVEDYWHWFWNWR